MQKVLTRRPSSSIQVLDGFPNSREIGASSPNVILLVKLPWMAECGKHLTTLHFVLNFLTSGFVGQLALNAT